MHLLHLVHLYRLAGAASRGVAMHEVGTVPTQLQPTGCMAGWHRVSLTSPFQRDRFRMNCECSLAPVFTYAPCELRGTATAFPPVGGRNVAWAQPLFWPPNCLRVDGPGPARLRNAREPSVMMDSWELTDQSACIIPAIAFLPPFPLRQRRRKVPPERDLDGQRTLSGQAAPPPSVRGSHAHTNTEPFPILTYHWEPDLDDTGSGRPGTQAIWHPDGQTPVDAAQTSRQTEQVANTNFCHHRRVGVLESNSASCMFVAIVCLIQTLGNPAGPGCPRSAVQSAPVGKFRLACNHAASFRPSPSWHGATTMEEYRPACGCRCPSAYLPTYLPTYTHTCPSNESRKRRYLPNLQVGTLGGTYM